MFLQKMLRNFWDFSIVDLFDVILTTVLLYQIYRLLRNSMGRRIFYGILIAFSCWKVAQLLGMALISQILGNIFNVGYVALIIIFQPELRRFLSDLGSGSLVHWCYRLIKKNLYTLYTQVDTIESIVITCLKFSKEKTGALIILQRKDPVKEFIIGGDYADILVTPSILENIFPKSSHLHDGAVLIVGNKIVRTRAGLPVPMCEKGDGSCDLGFRHKVAVGLCEETDAICIAISENDGQICYIKNKKQEYIASTKQLKINLMKDLRR